MATEVRFAILERTDPARGRDLAQLLQADVDERWRYYEQLAAMQRTVPHGHQPDGEQPVEIGARHRDDADDADEPEEER